MDMFSLSPMPTLRFPASPPRNPRGPSSEQHKGRPPAWRSSRQGHGRQTGAEDHQAIAVISKAHQEGQGGLRKKLQPI